jgi:dTDP-4-amino-4,6-dideoxygalactose transaminase
MSTKKIPYLDLHAQYQTIRTDVLEALEAVCESTRYTQGPVAAEFEQAFAEYCEAKYCVSVNSGTSALHLALRCLNIELGDEVITVPMTFIATAWAISYTGATPVFVDIDSERRTLDPTKLEAAITKKTKAILPVHLFGQPADLTPILEIGEKYNIPVIEDAAQAHGARYKGQRVGGIGKLGCFSFYPGKNLGGYGEGGALVTNDESFAVRARALRDHGQSKRYYHDEIAYNYRMDSFQAAILKIKLAKLDEWNAARAQKAQQYSELLKGFNLTAPTTFADSESVWHCYPIETKDRDKVRAILTDAGVETGIHYPIPLHLQKAYSFLGAKAGDFPASERFADQCISLPIYPELDQENLITVTKMLKEALV